MISALLVFTLVVILSLWLAGVLSTRHPGTKIGIYKNLLGVHILLSIAYFIYGSLTASDSFAYYWVVETNYRGSSWGEYYGLSTQFIEFLAYPLIKFLGLSYAAMMILFSWFGLIGFYLFYIFLKEQIRYEHKLFGYSLLLIILFLPNLHFWSSSLGKGSVVFLGFGLFFYSLNNISKRLLTMILGAIIIYHVRPHIMFVVLVASILGFVFSTKDVSWLVRLGVIMLAMVAFFYVYENVLALTGIDEESILEDSTSLTSRSRELMKANSGVDLSGYSFPMKLFTFWFRPLFIDSPGALGIIVSFENLFYLFLFFKIFRFDFVTFFSKSGPAVKAAFISFLGVSAALAQISANLGLAMRQKSQVMILILFVILKFMDERKAIQEKRITARNQLKERLTLRASQTSQ